MLLLYLIAIAVVAVCLLLTILLALFYFGLFDSVTVSTGPSPFRYGARQAWIRLGVGGYSQSSALFTEINSILPGHHTVGVYLDRARFLSDLKLTDREEGFLQRVYPTTPSTADDSFIFLIGSILDTEPSEQQLELLRDKHWHQVLLPPDVDHVVHAQFPYRGAMSVVVASRRVYRTIDAYVEVSPRSHLSLPNLSVRFPIAQEHRLCAYPKIEVYEGDNIHYLLPLSQQSEFIKLFQDELAVWFADQKLDDQEEVVNEAEDGEETSESGTDSSYEIVNNN